MTLIRTACFSVLRVVDSKAPRRSIHARVRRLVTLSLAIGLMLAASSARADHIPGAVYTGTHSGGGTVEFHVSADGGTVTGFTVTYPTGDLQIHSGDNAIHPGQRPLVRRRSQRSLADRIVHGGSDRLRDFHGRTQLSGVPRYGHLDCEDDGGVASRHDASRHEHRRGPLGLHRHEDALLHVRVQRAQRHIRMPHRRRSVRGLQLSVQDGFSHRRAALARGKGHGPGEEHRPDAGESVFQRGHDHAPDDHHRGPDRKDHEQDSSVRLPVERGRLDLQVSAGREALGGLRVAEAIWAPTSGASYVRRAGERCGR